MKKAFQVIRPPQLEILTKALKMPPLKQPSLFSKHYYRHLINHPPPPLQKFTLASSSITLLNTSVPQPHLLPSKPYNILLQHPPDIQDPCFKLFPMKDGKFDPISYLNQTKIKTLPQEYKYLQNEDGVYACGIPVVCLRQEIANCVTLGEMREIFRYACSYIQVFQELKTPWQLAQMAYPEFFVRPVDEYMAAFIAEMVEQQVNICWLGKSPHPYSLKCIFQHNYVQPLSTKLLPSPPKDTIVRNIQNYQIIEKHCMLDLLDRPIRKPLQIDELHVTARLIEFYGDPEGATIQDLKEIQKSCLLKYRKVQMQCLSKKTNVLKEKAAETVLKQW